MKPKEIFDQIPEEIKRFWLHKYSSTQLIFIFPVLSDRVSVSGPLIPKEKFAIEIELSKGKRLLVCIGSDEPALYIDYYHEGKMHTEKHFLRLLKLKAFW